MNHEEQMAHLAASTAKLEQENRNLASWVVELLETNERLRSRLEDDQRELDLIDSKLERITNNLRRSLPSARSDSGGTS